jgi:nucleoside-triphosphatase THEP1
MCNICTGPPGSGKSTVIAHIISSCLPDGDVTLATCVQNKAVDAIAGMPFWLVRISMEIDFITYCHVCNFILI